MRSAVRSAYQAEASGQLRVCRPSQSVSNFHFLINQKTEECDIKCLLRCDTNRLVYVLLYFKFILSINVAFKMRSVAFHLSYSVTPSNSGVCAGFQQPLKSFIS